MPSARVAANREAADHKLDNLRHSQMVARKTKEAATMDNMVYNKKTDAFEPKVVDFIIPKRARTAEDDAAPVQQKKQKVKDNKIESPARKSKMYVHKDVVDDKVTPPCISPKASSPGGKHQNTIHNNTTHTSRDTTPSPVTNTKENTNRSPLHNKSNIMPSATKSKSKNHTAAQPSSLATEAMPPPHLQPQPQPQLQGNRP